ncbi:MAG: DUF2480 family protein [Bacteroidetes bacterium]|nr:DUF2480 family protein [Bacteroidota bacterium]
MKEDQIINKVEASGLLKIDLEEFVNEDDLMEFDIKPFLFQETILKEKDFRASLKNIDWSVYESKIVGVYCSVDAIIPTWAYMLVAVYLEPYAKEIEYGAKEELINKIISKAITKLDVQVYANEKVIIRGCSKYSIPESSYLEIAKKLKPVVKSIMYGDACSTVPLYKRK